MPRLKEGRLTILSNGTGHTSRYGVLIGTKSLPPGDRLHQETGKKKKKKGKTSCHSCHLTTMVSVSQQIRVYSSSFTTSPTWITCIRDISLRSLSRKESNRLDHCYFCRFSDVTGTEASHDGRVREQNCHFITVQGSQVIRRY